MSNYPSGIDDGTTLPNPLAGSFTNNPDHATLHGTENDAIKALETKLGTGSSTATSATLLRGTGAGTTAFAQANLTTDVTGTLPVASGGTGVTSSTGTGSAVLSNTPSFTTPNIGAATGTSLTLGGIAVPTISSTNTLSGKSLDGGSNTFTNIPVGAIATTSGAYTAWTTSFTNWTIGTGGSAGTVSNYTQVGKTVNFYLLSTLGTSGESVGTSVQFTLPVAATTNMAGTNFGLVTILSAGLQYDGVVQLSGGRAVVTARLASGTYVQPAGLTATTPNTFTAGDYIRVSGSYEAA